MGRVLSLIGGRDLAGLQAELAPLTDGQRREAAAAVDAWSRKLRAEQAPLQGGRSWGEITWPLACAAVVGTFPAPAAAATALLRVDRQCRAFFVPAGLMVAMAHERGLTWLPDLAGRLAARLGGSPHTWVGLDQILRACHAPAPAGDAFLIGWLSTAARAGNQWLLPPGPTPAQQADWLQASPYLRDLLPRVFDADGAWRELESPHESWRGLIELSRREPEYRPLLLDGCLRRILLGGTAPALHPFAMLWSELAPGDDEVAARIAAYTAVAAAAAPRLATRALQALHALAGQGRLGLDDLLDLSAVVLARREKTLVNAQLRVLGRVADRHTDRLADILAVVEPATQHGDPAVRTAAASMLRKHATSVPDGIGSKLTAVADSTGASVRAEAAEERAASRIRFAPRCPGSPVLPEPPRLAEPRPLPRAPLDTAGLLDERLRQLDPLGWGSRGDPWEIAVEEVLDGLVRLRTSAADLERLLPKLDRFAGIGTLFTERDRPGLLSLAGELAGGRCGDPALLARYGVTRLRITELMARLDTSPVPWLVAVPTDTSGVIAPAVFLERLAAAETGGWEPWPLDLDQALLRTTRSVPPELAARAGALTSPAGRRLARWWSPARVGVTAWDGLIGVLLSRASDPDQVAAPRRSLAPAPHWLAALPHHHEAAAEWLVPLLTGDEDWAERWLMSENDDVRLLLGGGVLGPGLHAVLALRLGALSELRRETAAGILAGLLARPGANGAALGGDIGAAFAAGRASLERALPGLARVAAAQPERMWPVVAAVLPAVMASRHTRAFRLLEIASDLAAHLGRADAVPGLAEAAGGCSTHPLFFAGFATDPLAACRGILALAEVASSDFAFRRPPSGIDPVVTAGEGLLRLESVSRCAGVYARLDLLPAGLNGEIHQHGTTNVETGTQLRLALAQVRRRDPLRLAIGADAVTVSTLTGSVIERKVPLPPRWLRAFTEAQVITATFDLRAELASSEAMRFLQSLPRGRRRDVAWAVPDRRSLRLAAEPVPGAVCLPGPSRLRALTASWRPGTVLQAYGPAVTAASPPAASTWVLATPSARLSLTLSPGVDRGLSGEGAALSSLASPTAMDDADLVAALLAWEPVPDVSALAAASGLTPARVRAGLTVLATCGQIGYDVAEAAYFHRSLPFDTTEAERANPRLAAAKGLVAQGAVRLLGEGAAVTSGAQVYQLRPEGARLRCTCQWWTDHGGQRGPCKHELAVRIRQHPGEPVPAARPSTRQSRSPAHDRP